MNHNHCGIGANDDKRITEPFVDVATIQHHLILDETGESIGTVTHTAIELVSGEIQLDIKVDLDSEAHEIRLPWSAFGYDANADELMLLTPDTVIELKVNNTG